MVKAIFSAMLMDKIWAENMISQPIFCLCQQVQFLTRPEDEKLFLLLLPVTPFELVVWKGTAVQYNYPISVDRIYCNYKVIYIRMR